MKDQTRGLPMSGTLTRIIPFDELIQKGKDLRILAWDPGMWHTGMILLDGLGNVKDYFFITQTKSAVKDPARSIAYSMKFPTVELRNTWGQGVIAAELKRQITRMKPDLFAMEDYAFGMAGSSRLKTSMIELTGSVKDFLLRQAIPFRMYDPGSIKLFGCHKGNENGVVAAGMYGERWGMEEHFPWLKKTKGGIVSYGDLCVARAVAEIALTEVKLRTGETTLKGFHPQEVRIFNRVTKNQPLSLLMRPWCYLPDLLDQKSFEDMLTAAKEGEF